VKAPDLAERALAHARDADGLHVLVDEITATYLRWAGNTLTAAGETRQRRLTVVAMAAQGSGTSVAVVRQGGAPADDEVAALVADAERTARAGRPAPDASPLVGPAPGSEPGWADDASGRMEAADVRDVATGLGAALADGRKRGAALHGYAEQQVTTTWLASSTGLRRRHRQPAAVLDLTVRQDGRSAWAGSSAAGLAGGDLLALTGRLIDRLGRTSRRHDLSPGRYEVILSPSCVADLMLNVYLNADAADAEDGRSVFAAAGGGTRVGERLSGLPLTLRSDPAEPGLTCSPFVISRASGAAGSVFDNGLPLHPTRWIHDGELRSLVHTRASARDAGSPVTPRIDNLVLDGPPGRPGLDEMIARTERGVLVTCLWYLRDVDPRRLLLTGLTRDGVYLVESGEVVGSLPDFRFNESPVDLLRRVVEVGATEPALPREWGEYSIRTAMPPLRIEGFDVSDVLPG
jgi:predicted Zn-dependent protease